MKWSRLAARIGAGVAVVAAGVAICVWWLIKPQPLVELQARCAAKAGTGGPWLGGAYYSRFNARLDRCFAFSQSTSETPHHHRFETRRVFDALDGRSLATFVVMTDRPEEPYACSVELPSGERRSCQNEVEWESLVRVYLER